MCRGQRQILDCLAGGGRYMFIGSGPHVGGGLGGSGISPMVKGNTGVLLRKFFKIWVENGEF